MNQKRVAKIYDFALAAMIRLNIVTGAVLATVLMAWWIFYVTSNP
jgi:hypothetical protein